MRARTAQRNAVCAASYRIPHLHCNWNESPDRKDACLQSMDGEVQGCPLRGHGALCLQVSRAPGALTLAGSNRGETSERVQVSGVSSGKRNRALTPVYERSEKACQPAPAAKIQVNTKRTHLEDRRLPRPLRAPISEIEYPTIPIIIAPLPKSLARN